MHGAVRIVCLLLMLLGAAGPVVGRVMADEEAPGVVVIKVEGTINGVKERYIGRAIDAAEEEGAALLVIELDTPGGLLDSTRKIVEQLLQAPVPVAVYVSPRGAQAGSAGTFITAAGHFAVMAPGTNIGAATPVSGTGEELEETLASKVENDAAAFMRSIAQERGRNEDALEKTVREAASFSANEAVELNVVDFIADDLGDLLAQLDGRVVETAAGERTLETEGLTERRLNKNLLENFLEFISDPNVSFLLFTIGGLGIVIELFNPGLIAPGVIGVIALLLAFLAFGNLPITWAGVAFLLLAFALAALEIVVAGFGILGIGAIVSFIVGGVILFGGEPPTMPEAEVNRWLVGGVSGALALTLGFTVWMIYQSRRGGRTPSRQPLEGMQGTVTATLAPRGAVRVSHETWTAISQDGNVINEGETVKVCSVDGLILTVMRPEQAKE